MSILSVRDKRIESLKKMLALLKTQIAKSNSENQKNMLRHRFGALEYVLKVEQEVWTRQAHVLEVQESQAQMHIKQQEDNEQLRQIESQQSKEKW